MGGLLNIEKHLTDSYEQLKQLYLNLRKKVGANHGQFSNEMEQLSSIIVEFERFENEFMKEKQLILKWKEIQKQYKDELEKIEQNEEKIAKQV